MLRKMLRVTVMMLIPGALALAADPTTDDTKETVRTLDAITIEGAVDVPQVLFITSRDNARFDDQLGWTYLKAAETKLKKREWPLVIRPIDYPAAAKKESKE